MTSMLVAPDPAHEPPALFLHQAYRETDGDDDVTALTPVVLLEAVMAKRIRSSSGPGSDTKWICP
jgi:hypothetical protein